MNSDNKMRRYVHAPFTFEHDGVKAECDKDGKIIISKVSTEDGEEVEDIINTTAAFAIKLVNMLRASRKTVYVERN